MIKTRGFISIFLLVICGVVLTNAPVKAEDPLGEITLTPMSQPKLNVDEQPKVYLPSKLIIGENAIFKITGPAGSKVSLAMSKTNRGAKPMLGQKLRLGKTEMTIEGTIPATGAIELKLNVPKNESLVDQVRYFEVAVWKKDDYSDITIAKTMSPSGKMSYKNSVTYSEPYASGKRPSFAPVIPGMGQEIIKSIEQMKKAQEGETNPDLLDDGESPAYLDSLEKRDIMLHNIDR